ncbi:MAG TPA: GspE/PulE family protein [Armatimonadota bacterium]|nr:GspE/PulE family protein [Armatimonadota bacterium]
MTLQEAAGEAWKAEETALVELSNKIVAAAVADNASDIHIDPAPKESKVRLRIDGVMHDALTLPKNVHDPLVTRFKTMADLDTANHRAIQTGRIFVSVEGQEHHLRECVLPTVYGEKLTLRTMPDVLPTLDRIGYRESDRERLDRCLHQPCGLLVFSGPTGCGKTTIMHSALNRVISPERVLMSVEDPVEILLPGVIQIGVNRKLGISHADVLCGVLRSDPDIIMVGDVPDAETLEQVLQAAITGHLVMTTVHANDAALAIQRLLQIGADPFLLAQGLLMVSSQRLARRVHADCKQPVEYPAEVVAEWRRRAEAGGLPWPDEPPTFYKGAGCDKCMHTGYYGRMGVFEIMVMDPELMNLVATGADASRLREAAIRGGTTTMFADGMAKVIAGETTAEEVVRVLGGAG